MDKFENLFLNNKELNRIFECSLPSLYYYLNTNNIIKEERKEKKKKTTVVYSVLDLSKQLDKKPFKGFDGNVFLKKVGEFFDKKIYPEIKKVEEEELEDVEEEADNNTLGIKDLLEYEYVVLNFKGDYKGIMVPCRVLGKKIYVYKYNSEFYTVIEKTLENYLESAIIKLIPIEKFKKIYPLSNYCWLTGGDNE